MHRRKFIQQSVIAIGVLTLSEQSILQAMSVDPWKITMLTPGIGYFTERGGTIGFHISRDGITVVDAQFPDTAAHLVAELKKKSSQPFSLLINTHHHGDHTSGNIVFKDLVKHVLAHENSLANQKRVAAANNTEEKQLYPDSTFGKTWVEHAGKEKISLSYFGAGHTNGDAIIHFQHANIAHVGDLVFNRRHPYIDRSAGANIKSWINVLDQTKKSCDKKTTFICGHAAEGADVKGSHEMLSAFQEYLGNLLTFVEKEIKAGKSKEEILKTTEIPGSPEWKGDGIERPLTAAFEELTSI